MISFRILRSKKKISKEKLRTEDVKRRIVLFSDSWITGFRMPEIKVSEKVGDFILINSEGERFKLRAESSGVREQWLQCLAQYCTGAEKFAGSGPVSGVAGKHDFLEKYVHFRDYGLDEPLVTDNEMVRVAIPGD